MARTPFLRTNWIRGLLQTLQALAHSGERGAVSTAVVALSLMGSTAVVGSSMVASGDMVGQQLDSVLRSSIVSVSGVFMVRGDVVMTASGKPLAPETIQFRLGSIGITPVVSSDLADANRLVLSYYDSDSQAVDVPYTLRLLTGNGDQLFDPGELAEVTVRLTDLPASALRPGDSWTLTLTPPSGATLNLSRRLPVALSPVMLLP